MVRTPGGLTATNTEFSNLLEMSFQTRLIDLSRVPDSLRSQRFDIIAKAAGKISGDQYWEMLQTLLEERFKLAFHREIKDAQVYALIIANKGAKRDPDGTQAEPLHQRRVSREPGWRQLLRSGLSTRNDKRPTSPHGPHCP